MADLDPSRTVPDEPDASPGPAVPEEPDASPGRGESAEPAIGARGLTKRFRDVLAVDALTFSVDRGALFGLVGPDGAGKSTLIRMLATVLHPSAGDALIFGHSVVGDSTAVKPRIGYMSQRFSLYGDLTVQENLDFFAELRGIHRSERAERSRRLLAFAGLSGYERRQAQFLSGGMKQKLALAATLISEPDLIFLDEPTTGVDPVSRREFWRIISDLHRRGVTIFVATQYMDEAERCARVAFMDCGRIVALDAPAGLKAAVPGRLFELSVSDQRRAVSALGQRDEVLSAEIFGDLVRVLSTCETDCESRLAAILADKDIRLLRAREVPVAMETAFSWLSRSASATAPREGALS